MRDLLHRRPSPSLAVAIAAVVIASSGSAVAASMITTKQIKNGTIQLVDLNKATRDALRRERGPQGPVGPSGAAGAAGATGAPGLAGPGGAAGAPGSAIAFARVAADRTVDPAASSGIALLAGGVGTYCLDRTGGGVENFVATINEIAVAGFNPTEIAGTAVPSEIAASNCPSGTDVLVTTRENSIYSDVAFYIAIIA